MSQPTQPTSSPAAESSAQNATVPIWLIVLMVLLLFVGGIYFDDHGGWFEPKVYGPYVSLPDVERYQPVTGGIDLARGKKTFENICALCHGVSGEGKPGQAPPLAGSEWAQGSLNQMIRIPLVGLTGPIQVNGQDYNLSMTAMGAALSDDDLASVLSYIRQSFGNKASPVSAEQVARLRAEVTKNHPLAYTPAELKKLQE